MIYPKTEKAHLNTYPYTSNMARASKRFCLTMLWPCPCQFIASFGVFLWCYSQNSRLIPKTGKKRTQMPIATPPLLTKRIGYSNYYTMDCTHTNSQPFLGCICGAIPRIVAICSKTEKAHSNTCSNTSTMAQAHM